MELTETIITSINIKIIEEVKSYNKKRNNLISVIKRKSLELIGLSFSNI